MVALRGLILLTALKGGVLNPFGTNKRIFEWACNEVKNKKDVNIEKARYLKTKEELCVQCMHIGPFDEESKTVMKMEKYLEENNFVNAINEERHHHEIYIGY